MNHEVLHSRVSEARVARVATLDDRSRSHLVPIVFVLDGSTIYSSTDETPRRAKRLRNIERDPTVVVLVDHYEEDWTNVWWVRLRGRGRVVECGPEYDRARRLLAEKYPQYKGDPPPGPIMAIDIGEWRGWSYEQSE